MCGGGKGQQTNASCFRVLHNLHKLRTHHVISNAKLSTYRGGVVSWYPLVCYRFAIWRVVIRLEPCSRTQPPPPPPLKPPTKAPTPPTSFLPSHPSCNFLIKKLTQQQWVSIRWEFETNTKDRRYRHWYLIFFLHTWVHVNLKGERQEQISRWLIDRSITSA